MRIAYGSTILQHTLRSDSAGGIGRYVAELAKSLEQREDIDLKPFVLSGRDFLLSPERLAGNADLIHATDHFIPRARSTPVVATLHDAIPLSHPAWISDSFRTVKNYLWKSSACRADHILTASENSKQEVLKWFGVPEERISVTPLGVDQRWFAEVSEENLQRVREAHQLPERYFLFVGTLQPRKNIGRIIEAHRSLPSSLRRQVPLIVAGRAGWKCEAEIAELEHGDEGTLRWLRHVPEADLPPLYKQATALVLPSLYEGFGLPVLEAFAAGLPVVTSNTTSLPEVAGDAALLVNPCNVGEIAAAMRACLNSRDLSESLAGKGRDRAGQFTWERTATLTASVYRRVLGESGAAPRSSPPAEYQTSPA